MNFCSILSSRISPTSYQMAVEDVINWARQEKSRAIYAANVHMVMLAYDSPDFLQIVNSADIVTPDGMPLVWSLRLKGYKDQQRVYGPTLMLEVCAATAREHISVGFLGGTVELLDALSRNLRQKFPELSIDLLIAPPFHELSLNEDNELITQIKASKIQILFVGLGCPKQEKWIYEHKAKIQAVMIGVGAAFAFHAGKVRQAPRWMQKIGLEWLFRLSQEPGRLWKRYLYTNPRFIFLESMELLRERFHIQRGHSC